MRGIRSIDPGWGITAVRVAMALVLIHAGWLKFFQYGVNEGVTAAMTKYGLPVPAAFAWTAATMELVGGGALLIGLFVRWLGLFYAVEFIIAAFWVKLPAGFPGARIDLLILAGAILLFLGGSGRAALDELRSS